MPAHGGTPLGGNSYRYTPTAGYAGRDTFTCTVSDGTGGTARGYTQVVTTTAAGLPVALANADVRIPGWLGSAPSAALMTVVTNFASTGNALIICDYSPGYSWWWGKNKWDIPGSKVLREAGIGFAEDDCEGAPFTINRANDQMTLDTLLAILNNSTGYSRNLKDLAAATLTRLSQCLNPNDIAYARLLAACNSVIGTITPTPQNPITDSLQRALLDFECGCIAKLPPASMISMPASPRRCQADHRVRRRS